MPSPPREIDTLVDGVLTIEVQPTLGEAFAGRYRIERCLGRGSMGSVYAAHDEGVDERVAIKVLANPSERALARFRREVRLARKVTHRNAARTFDLGEVDGMHFITMELVEGESLSLRLARATRLGADEVAEIARQVCLGLQAAHDVGVIHRDLKPANVLIEPQGRAVITDFGVACSTVPRVGTGAGAGTSAGTGTVVSEEAGVHIDIEPDATIDDAPMAGTPAYMAPEQVLGLLQDGRTDLYALGVMLFELLTGRTPWRGGNHIEVAMARMLEPPPDPRALVVMPDALAQLVLECMAREPTQRPPSASAVVQRLLALGSTAVSVPLPAPPGPPPPARSVGEGSSSQGRLFARTALGEHALAVMPFRYRGPPDEAYLAEALTDELIDLLAMTRGLRVSASGATHRYRDERDARTVGRALGVSSVIDGTVQRIDAQVRIVARLVDVDTGFQRWSERFAGRLEDVFELQDRMAKRVAEALRVELTLQEQGAVASREAVEQYLRGRAVARGNDVAGVGFELALECFGRARAAAPAFVLPLAAIADACVRRWYVAQQGDGERWAEASRLAVDEALHGAPGLAETQLAAARYQVNRGDFAAAAQHLESALQIAPTCAAAHEYLGMLQCDAGRSREGAAHIELALELDPTLGMGAFALLRHHALRGDRERYEPLLQRVAGRPGVPRFAVDLFELRFALWRGDLEHARTIHWPTTGSGNPLLAVVEALRRVLDPSTSDAELAELLDLAYEQAASPRLRTTWQQLSAELLAWRGAHDLALRVLSRADQEAKLCDADWVEQCPLFTALQGLAEFEEIRERVRGRADEIWQRGGRP